MVAASPDAIVSCKCCGVRPLEVKNPYKSRHLPVHKYAELEESCLHITPFGQIRLKATHPYYYQVQGQLLAMGVESGYFAVKTASMYSNFHWEEIFFDPHFMEDVLSRCVTVFAKIIIPELLYGKVK